MFLYILYSRNKNVTRTRNVMKNMTNSVLQPQVATLSLQGAKRTPPYICCSCSDDSLLLPGFKRVQFPIWVWVAIMTKPVRKQLFEEIFGPYIHEYLFPHWDLHVAILRARRPSSIILLSEKEGRKPRT